MEKFLYSITLDKLIEEFDLEEIYIPLPPSEIKIVNKEVNRPGLALAGFFEVFEPSRIQLIGKAEAEYLRSLDDGTREERLDEFFSHKPVAVIVTSNLDLGEWLVSPARLHGVPILRTGIKTSPVMATLIASLNQHLANRITQHGVLVEVYGEGVLILGESGIGKSETAIALVERGHRLIADDAVEIKRVSAKTLVGSAPDLIRHYVELRGIGIIDVRRMYGMSAVKMTEKIDLVVHLEPWVEGKMYDRFGLEDQTYNILGIDIPSITIPVRPGRSLPIILEIAAMNHRQKKMGYNTAAELEKQLLKQFGAEDEE